MVAGCAGLGLLGVAFLPWFGLGGASTNMWESFRVADVVVDVAIGCAVLTALFALRGDASGLPVVGSTITTGVVALAFVMLAYRLIDPPGEGLEREIGSWLGPLLAAAMGLASHRGMADTGGAGGAGA